MKIANGSIDSLGSGNLGSVGGTGSDSRSSASASPSKSDSVSLSSAANLVALAKAGAASRQSKLEGISGLIKSGSYQADDAQVSHAVVQNHISS
jgi:anti-sigma28 factor (negative regulator of flagellin synthesis)